MSRIILSKANEIIKTLDVKRVVLIGDYTDQWVASIAMIGIKMI